jgi:hypothetical protein
MKQIRRPLRSAILPTPEPRNPLACLVPHLICQCIAAMTMAAVVPFPWRAPCPPATMAARPAILAASAPNGEALNGASSHRVPIGLG